MKPILSSILLILAALLLSGVAHAEEEPPVGVPDAPLEGGAPDVVGKKLDEALQTLDDLGLEPRIVTIAAGEVGVVREQTPAAKEGMHLGDELTIVVGIEPLIQTIVPDVIGRDESQLDVLRETYFVRVRYVEGDRAQAGQVVAQDPEAGASLPARGELVLEIVEGNALVPSIVGKTEAEARKLVEAARLRIDVTYVEDDAAAAGIVLSQEPKSGVEALPLSTVSARVTGPAPEAEDPAPTTLLVPDLVGLAIEDAQKALHALDLVPAPAFRTSSDAEPWTVLEQDPAVGAEVESGSIVRFVVAKAPPEPEVQLAEVPRVIGFRADQAAGRIFAEGLQPRQALRFLPSASPRRVAEQYPEAGALVPRGTRVTFVLPQVGVMPNLLGLACPDAQKRLEAAGFRGLGIQMGSGPGPAEVTWQEVPAGALVARGTSIRFRCTVVAIPEPLVHVPNVLGLTRSQAHAALAAEGFQVETELVGGVGPMTEVIQQMPHGGALRVHGSTVRIRYERKGFAPLLQPVPDVVGKTAAKAKAILEAAGFQAHGQKVGPSLGPVTEVFDQDPNAGVMRPKGSHVKFRFKAKPFAQLKPVPSVLGLTRQQARTKLQNAGFQVHLQSVGGFGPKTTVVDTDPNPGTPRPVGSTVVVKYKRTGAIQPLKPVPNVLGKTVTKAKTILQGNGFQVQTIAVGGMGPKTQVVSTSPAPGIVAAPGSVVKVRYKRVLQPIGPGVGPLQPVKLVTVPNVVGLKKSKAKQIMLSAGLKPVFFGPSLAPRVKTQSIPPGKKVSKGTTVKLKRGF